MNVINLFAGPGSGKSTTCAGVFNKLKLAGINCEMALEYAKDKVWEKSFHTLDNQIYVFGKQLHRLWRLKDQVDIIITDSPLLFSILYDKSSNDKFRELVLDQFNQFNNINYFIERDQSYNPKGRMQTMEESMQLDSRIKEILGEYNIPCTYVAEKNDKWTMFKNYMHNELGITKDDIRVWLKEAVQSQAELMLQKTFDDFDMDKFVRNHISTQMRYWTTEEVRRQVASLLADRLVILSTDTEKYNKV